MTRCSASGREPALPAANRHEARVHTLVRAARKGDRLARESVVLAHLGLVRRTAVRYHGLGLPHDDLVQEGAVGLLEAIDGFDPSRGVDFEPFARFSIRRAIRRALTDQARLVRLPKTVVEHRRLLARTEATLTAASGRTPTALELASATGLSLAAVREARGAPITPVALEEGALADGGAMDPERAALERERARILADAIETLPDRQCQVVMQHYGLGGTSDPIAVLADELHVSQERTRAIERDALSRLRAELGRVS